MRLFMIGTQRSGSNLLRLMLNQASDVAAPHPPHILERLSPLIPIYGELSDEANFARLVEDVCQLVETNPVPWGVRLLREEIARHCRERSLVAVYGAVMDEMAVQKGKGSWLCKSMANVHFLPELRRYFGDARYLYLYRDGRDVAASFLKAIVGPKTAYHIAKQWHDEQQLAIDLSTTVTDGRFIAIRYEDLTSRPEPILQRLCDWMDIAFTPAMLDFYRSDEAQRTASSGRLWENVVKPVMSPAGAGWREKLTVEDARVFETVASTSLAALGYPLELVGPGRYDPFAFTREDLVRFDAINAQRREEVVHDSPEEVAAREGQELVLASIRSRAAA